jgi:hypothetical protein
LWKNKYLRKEPKRRMHEGVKRPMQLKQEQIPQEKNECWKKVSGKNED